MRLQTCFVLADENGCAILTEEGCTIGIKELVFGGGGRRRPIRRVGTGPRRWQTRRAVTLDDIDEVAENIIDLADEVKLPKKLKKRLRKAADSAQKMVRSEASIDNVKEQVNYLAQYMKDLEAERGDIDDHYRYLLINYQLTMLQIKLRNDEDAILVLMMGDMP